MIWWSDVDRYLLGYEIDFGHMEVITLISSPNFQEKQVGYLAAAVLFKNTDQLFTLIVNSMRNDVIGGVEVNQILSLSAVANLGGQDLAETLLEDILQLVTKDTTTKLVKQKCALTLLSLFRSSPDTVGTGWVDKVMPLFDVRANIGGALAVSGLLANMIPHIKEEEVVDEIRHLSIGVLRQLVLQKDCSDAYKYHDVPCPWLVVNCLRILKSCPYPSSKKDVNNLEEALRVILERHEMTKNANYNNATHGELFEAVNLIISYGNETDPELRSSVVSYLGRFIQYDEPNIRYLGLVYMSRLAQLAGVTDKIKRHEDVIMSSLEDPDLAIRKRALHMLFSMCDEDNAEGIVKKLLEHLQTSDYMIKEEMALKVAILAERFPPDNRWYVDVIVDLILYAGDYVSDDIWHRMVQIVSQQEDLQEYAARKLFEMLQPTNVHESMIRAGAYVLGEYASYIVEPEEEDAEEVEPEAILETLQRHYTKVNLNTQILMMTAFAKLLVQFEELEDEIRELFETNMSHIDSEMQQRVVEYNALADSEVMEDVLDQMPPFAEDRENVLELKLKGAETPKEDSEYDDSDDDDDDDDDDSDDDDDDDDEDDDEEEEEEEEEEEDGEAEGIDEAAEEKIPTWFTNCLIKNKAVLYQDARIQIGITKDIQVPEAHFNMFYSNKSGAVLKNFSAELASEESGLNIECTEVKDTIEAGANAKQQITVSCGKPFSECPTLTVSFTCKGKAYELPLEFPVVAMTFFQESEMDADTFQQKWSNPALEEKQAKEMFTAGDDKDIETLETLLPALNLAIIEDVDESANKVYAAGTLVTSRVAASGKPVTVAVMCLFEWAKGKRAFRLTVRSSNATIAAACKEHLKTQLA